MKRLMMIAAIAVAANFAAFDIQPASANDAHHPAQVTKSNNLKVHTKGKAKSVKSSRMQMMKCPMMKGGKMMQGGMMKGGRKCPMMGAGKMHRMGMMQNVGSGQNTGPGMMGASGMHQGDAMMGRPAPCLAATARERGFGYPGACDR
jgi:hypothetical protein